MNQQDLRTLRGQLALTAGLFAGCVALAAVIISQRFRFESFVAEKYPASREKLSPEARAAADAIADASAPAKGFNHLPAIERRALYEFWMRDPESRGASEAQALLAADPQFYLRCAEQSVVCGNDAQRRRALEFIAFAESESANEVLLRLADWSKKRHRPDWGQEIQATRIRDQSS